MVKLYLVRHCESAGNKSNLFQGSVDCDISENGIIQLKYLRGRFRDIHIDKVFSSPLIRAYKTALAATEGKGLKVVRNPLFAEMDIGIVEGKPLDEIENYYPNFFDVWDNRMHEFSPAQGESATEVSERMWRGLEALLYDPENDGKTILVASHGAAIRTVICRLTFGNLERLSYTPWSRNTAVSLIVKDENGVHLEYANDDSHVPENLRKAGRLLSVRED